MLRYNLPKFKNRKLAEKIKTITNFIVKTLDPEEVILFGSLVKKQKETGFDIDIFVRTDQPIEHRTMRKLKENIDDLAGIYTVDIVLSYQASKELISIIEKEGVVLYAKGWCRVKAG